MLHPILIIDKQHLRRDDRYRGETRGDAPRGVSVLSACAWGAEGLPDVSIVIPSWNAKGHLLDCLRSIEVADTTVSMQTIVVDNASSDASAKAVEEAFPHVEVVCNSENLGFARAVNVGIARTSGRYVCLMNSDIVVRPGALGALVRFMDARPGVALVGPRVLNPDGSVQPSCRRFPGLARALKDAFAMFRLLPRSGLCAGEVMTDWDHDSERSVDAINGCFCLARREAVRAVGPLDERFFFYCEDVDWCMRFHAAGWDVRFTPEAEAVHHGAASSSIEAERFALEMQRARMQLFRKHYSRSATACFACLAFVDHLVRLIARLMAYVLRPARRRVLALKIREHIACLQWMLRV